MVVTDFKSTYQRMTPAEQHRQLARNYSQVYYRRGKLKRYPCRDCGDWDTQMHHSDYSKPLDVEWLCRPCHRKLHKDEREVRAKILAMRAEKQSW